jgi:hypothetical protein
MVKVRVPVMVKDPEVARWKDVPMLDWFTLDEEFVLDGPVSRQVAVVDFDPKSGRVVPGARFRPPTTARGAGSLDFPQDRLDAPAFLQATAFGGVMKTISMFQERDALGRKIAWGFPGPQLLVVPRAGEWPNAFYERASRSLQLFYFQPEGRDRPVFTCHSQDILAHECTHAILDGIAPDLYSASSPQSLAIHEAVADLGALLMAFRCRPLARRVLSHTGGSLDHSTAFTGIAEQFASALHGREHLLRELNNTRKLGERGLDESEPHALSEVLSGALYRVMVKLHEDQLRKAGQPAPGDAAERAAARASAASDLDASARFQRTRDEAEDADGPRDEGAVGRAFWIATEIFKRLLLRGLDYLPPGEAGFLDLMRAILASDQASFPEDRKVRGWVARECVARRIVKDERELAVATNTRPRELEGVDPATLVESDFAAYQFAEQRRRFLGIPRGIPFVVRPRLDVTKHYYLGNSREELVRECLFKVSWSEKEKIGLRSAGGLPPSRRVTRGTTLAIAWERHTRDGSKEPWTLAAPRSTLRAILHGAPASAQRGGRDALLARLLAQDALRIGPAGLGPDGRPLRGSIHAEVVDDTLVPRHMARLLHLSEVR